MPPLRLLYGSRIAFFRSAFCLLLKLRVNGFHDALTDDLLHELVVGKLQDVAWQLPPLLPGSLSHAYFEPPSADGPLQQ